MGAKLCVYIVGEGVQLCDNLRILRVTFFMKSIFSAFWHICTFRSGPDRLPADPTFLGLVVAVNMVLSLILLVALNDVPLLQAITLIVVNVAAVCVLVWAIMSLMELSARYQQTITAMFGVDLILSSITNLATWLMRDSLPTAGAEVDPANVSWQFFIIAFLVLWSIGVNGFVMHRSIEVHIGFGIAIALFILIFATGIAQSVVVL